MLISPNQQESAPKRTVWKSTDFAGRPGLTPMHTAGSSEPGPVSSANTGRGVGSGKSTCCRAHGKGRTQRLGASFALEEWAWGFPSIFWALSLGGCHLEVSGGEASEGLSGAALEMNQRGLRVGVASVWGRAALVTDRQGPWGRGLKCSKVSLETQRT